MEELTGWTVEDTEDVVCCLCRVPGTLVHDVAPFGVVRCPQCELVFISPRLRPEALQRIYDDAGYFEGGVYGSAVSTDAAPSVEAGLSPAMLLQRTWTAGRLALIDRERGGAAAGGRLLEVGAGYGLFLAAARAAGWTTSGVELSRTGAKHAQDTLGLDVFCGQLEEAPLTPGFDVVCAWDTVEHVPDPLSFWRTVRSQVADDGVVLFSTPYVSSLPARLLGTRWWTLKPTEHIWHFTPRTHALLLARAGLALTRVVRNPLAPANAGRLDSLVGVARPIPDA
ncbi:class I SAM-dependent methyltransferase [Geodermatophilus obscurus]|uniref:Methyltransferase type 12 n=1 Tax=Geodermatophilus obscurus (strain ATCC 25078 / DSM 43160 / JCM 3152 / CCUG 61914 / KCC A-0152 / KCTC 9177 / NBRC 13315 / NRRL B-3577 / G-20) TaxID=526225 RepID=D2S4J6_GEOOG|nr:class I SAM-dependent methyltransferase [Geodermatophilus obscurus]ADB77146.1 Methyltransferase type 12 [Geodermatophilus obscurus DSM 43160]